MKKLLATLFVLVSLVTVSYAKSPLAVKAQIIQDSNSELVYLKVSKLTNNKETFTLQFKNEKGQVIKTVQVDTEHYTTVKKLKLGNLKADKVTVEVL